MAVLQIVSVLNNYERSEYWELKVGVGSENRRGKTLDIRILV